MPPTLVGLYGGNSAPTAPSNPGGRARTRPPTPCMFVQLVAAAAQMAASHWSDVLVPVGRVDPAAAPEASALTVVVSVSNAYWPAKSWMTMSMIAGDEKSM